MPRFQRYGFPFQYYRPYNYMPPSPTFRPTPPVQPEPACVSQAQSQSQNIPPPRPVSKCVKPEKDNVWLDIFGIKLYFDDVLILSLLFFLYKEEVKDEGLFLALVLLLIS